jgi:hypothetical protein
MTNTENVQKVVTTINNLFIEARHNADLFHNSYVHWLTDYVSRVKEELDPVLKELSESGNREDCDTGKEDNDDNANP